MGVLDRAAQLQAQGEAFAIATVIRTLSVTAAKAGAKAIIARDGSVQEGWIGGGCARAAVLRAAQQCLQDGQSRLVSITPKDALDDLGVAPGEVRDGVTFAKNACPSQGTMDIFVEPVLPLPRLAILGASPVAKALAALAPGFGFEVTGEAGDYVVVATQGAGDRAGLKAAALAPARYAAFVGSRRKAETLKRELAADGVPEAALARVKAPAGLDIHAITSEEIALSILAEMISIRRAGERPGAPL